MEENQKPCPETHMVKAILTTLFCCLPFGIAAIIHASRVESLWRNGQQREAEIEAEDANKYGNYALYIGLICGVISFVVNLAAEL